MPRKKVDIVGSVINYWTVLNEETATGERRFLCQCKCGSPAKIHTLTGIRNIISCGCLKSETNRRIQQKIQPNIIFGKLKTLRPISKKIAGTASWECQCSCGSSPVIVRSSRLISGRIQNCGCENKKG